MIDKIFQEKLYREYFKYLLCAHAWIILDENEKEFVDKIRSIFEFALGPGEQENWKDITAIEFYVI